MFDDDEVWCSRCRRLLFLNTATNALVCLVCPVDEPPKQAAIAVALPTIAPDLGPVPSVVQALEYALERARRGEVRGVAIVLVNTGREVAHTHELGDGGVASLVLGTAYLQQALLQEGTV